MHNFVEGEDVERAIGGANGEPEATWRGLAAVIGYEHVDSVIARRVSAGDRDGAGGGITDEGTGEAHRGGTHRNDRAVIAGRRVRHHSCAAAGRNADVGINADRRRSIRGHVDLQITRAGQITVRDLETHRARPRVAISCQLGGDHPIRVANAGHSNAPRGPASDLRHG